MNLPGTLTDAAPWQSNMLSKFHKQTQEHGLLPDRIDVKQLSLNHLHVAIFRKKYRESR